MATLNQGIKIPSYDVSTTQGVIPAATSGSGTFDIASGTRVTGTGSFFTTEIKQGDYLFNSATFEVRRIKHILNDTILDIESSFLAPVFAEAVSFVKKQDISNILQIGILNNGGADGIVDEDVLPDGTSVNFSDSGGIGPLTFNAVGTTFRISKKTRG